MEAWAIVALVLGSDAIILLGNWLLMKRQVKHSEDEFEKRIQAQREEYQHRQRWDVRSKPLLELRAEVASMAEKLEKIVSFAARVPLVDGVPLESDDNFKDAEKALEEWNAYIDSGEFYRVEHMQYDLEIAREAHKILHEYILAYGGVMEFWNGRGKEDEIHKAEDAIKGNARRISTLQSRINGLLEEL